MIRATNFKKFERGPLQGFFDAEILPFGLIIRGLSYFQDETGKRWVTFPSKAYENRQGGTSYVSHVEFIRKSDHYAFQFDAIKAIDQYFTGQSNPVGYKEMAGAMAEKEKAGATEPGPRRTSEPEPDYRPDTSGNPKPDPGGGQPNPHHADHAEYYHPNGVDDDCPF